MEYTPLSIVTTLVVGGVPVVVPVVVLVVVPVVVVVVPVLDDFFVQAASVSRLTAMMVCFFIVGYGYG